MAKNDLHPVLRPTSKRYGKRNGKTLQKKKVGMKLMAPRRITRGVVKFPHNTTPPLKPVKRNQLVA